MLALLGKTGCGKSTIFNMIAGLTEPTSAAYWSMAGTRSAISTRSSARSAIVFQNDRLLPWRTAFRTSNSDWRCSIVRRRASQHRDAMAGNAWPGGP